MGDALLHLILIHGEPYLTPAEKLTTGKKNPSVLKSSNMPWTGCPLILKDMLGAPRSRQQLTTSSEFSRCWLMEATALGIRPRQHRTETEREDGWLLGLQSHFECRAGWWASRKEMRRWVISTLRGMSWNRWGEVMGLLVDLKREERWNRFYAVRMRAEKRSWTNWPVISSYSGREHAYTSAVSWQSDMGFTLHLIWRFKT